MGRISVCIPVFKAEAYIEKCARSLFEQTYENLEFIFVDDLSPDKSIEVLTRVLAQYPTRQSQVKIIRHAENGGSAKARSSAIQNASGEWIGFLDSDDWLDENFFEKLINAAEKNGADVAFGNMVLNENTPMRGESGDGFVGTGKEYLDQVGRFTAFHSTCNKIYRRSLILAAEPEAPEPIGIGEDTCFMVQVVSRANKVVGVGDVAYHYFENPNSKTHAFNAEKYLSDIARVYEVLARRLPEGSAERLLSHLARDIAFYGFKLGVHSGKVFKFWCKESKRRAPGCWLEQLPKKRALILAIADLSFYLGRSLLKLLPNEKVKAI